MLADVITLLIHFQNLYTRRLDLCNDNVDDCYDDSIFDRIRGEDSWIGRQVRKKFLVGKGRNKRWQLFHGTVTAVDDDEDNPGHRLFQVTYEDGDDEWLDVCNTQEILHATPVRKQMKHCARLCK